MDGGGWWCWELEDNFGPGFSQDGTGGSSGITGGYYVGNDDIFGDMVGPFSEDNPLEIDIDIPDCPVAPQDRIVDAKNLICAQLGTMGCVGTSLIGSYWKIGFDGGATFGVYKWARPMQATLPLNEVRAPNCSI